MVEEFKCTECGSEEKNIPQNLRCSKCGIEYIRSEKLNNYLVKNMKCLKCGKRSATIATNYSCDKCKAAYESKRVSGIWDYFGVGILMLIFVGILIMAIYQYVGNYDRGGGIVLGIFSIGALYYFGSNCYKDLKNPQCELVIAQPRPVEEVAVPVEAKPKKETKKSVAIGKAKAASYAMPLPEQGESTMTKKPKDEINWVGGLIAAIILIAICAGIFIWIDSGGKLGWNKVEVSDMSFSVPSDWTVDKYSDPNFVAVVLGPDEGNSRPNFNIQQSYGAVEDFDYEASEAKKGLELGGAEVKSQYDMTVGGKQAKGYSYNTYVADKGYYGRGTAILIKVNSNELVMVVFATKESTYWKNVAIFDEIMRTMKFKS